MHKVESYSIPEYIGWAVAVYLDALKAKKEE
jgi:hypothetical protein